MTKTGIFFLMES